MRGANTAPSLTTFSWGPNTLAWWPVPTYPLAMSSNE